MALCGISLGEFFAASSEIRGSNPAAGKAKRKHWPSFATRQREIRGFPSFKGPRAPMHEACMVYKVPRFQMQNALWHVAFLSPREAKCLAYCAHNTKEWKMLCGLCWRVLHSLKPQSERCSAALFAGACCAPCAKESTMLCGLCGCVLRPPLHAGVRDALWPLPVRVAPPIHQRVKDALWPLPARVVACAGACCGPCTKEWKMHCGLCRCVLRPLRQRVKDALGQFAGACCAPYTTEWEMLCGLCRCKVLKIPTFLGFTKVPKAKRSVTFLTFLRRVQVQLKMVWAGEKIKQTLWVAWVILYGQCTGYVFSLVWFQPHSLHRRVPNCRGSRGPGFEGSHGLTILSFKGSKAPGF